MFRAQLALVLSGVIALIAACSSEQPETAQTADSGPYAGWKVYLHNNIRVHYPENHPMARYVEEMTEVFPALIRRDAEFFRIPAPTDTIDVYYYTGPGHGHDITGTYYPFADTAAIHFWLPSNYGPIVAQFMIKRWYPRESQFQFLERGLTALLEFAGVNYHERTLTLIDSGKFVPLARLATDTTTDDYPDIEPERVERALGASFADFLVVRYGIRALGAMYSSPLPFDSTVHRMFSISVDSLQSQWLDFVPQAANPEQLLDTLQGTENKVQTP